MIFDGMMVYFAYGGYESAGVGAARMLSLSTERERSPGFPALIC
uniref:Uncharacterized protein n=1 Tax=Anguilla anguilla TaxID=7936 RepID=A0A0E9QEE0_ANGAN